MITVLVVDDERIIREGLIRLISEKCPAYQVVGEAADGEAALELTRRLHPQVAIVDIRMPVMGGIDYMRLAAGEQDSPRFIVLTGYADFEYARQLMGLGCEGYLLKPLKHRELTELMAGVAAKVLQRGERPTLKGSQGGGRRLEEILRGVAMGQSLQADELAAAGLDCLKGSYWQILISVDGVAQLRSRLSGRGMDQRILNWYGIPEAVSRLALPAPLRGVAAAMTDRTTALILYDPTGAPLSRDQAAAAARRVRGAAEGREGLRVTLGVSGPYQGAEAYPLCNEQCTCAVGYRFYDGGGQTFFYDPSRPLSARPDAYLQERQLLAALDVGDGEAAACCLKELLNRLAGDQVRKSAAVMVLSKLYVEMVNVLEKKGWLYALNTLPSCEAFETLLSGQDLFSQMGDQLERVMDLVCQGLPRAQGGSRAVQLAMRYVQAHLNQPVAAADVAQSVGMNASYFSVLFKKETGENFVGYVNRIKMERAKELLRHPACKVYEVCSQVGYEDAKYFAKLFRRMVGMTPREYREGQAKA